MDGKCSIRLELTGTGVNKAWKLFNRTRGQNPSIDIAHPISPALNPSEILKTFRTVVTRHNVTDLRMWSADNLSQILPSTIQHHLDNFDGGDVTFVVAPEWAEIPFELLLSNGDFLCMHFRCGTIISVKDCVKPAKPNLSEGEMLVISYSPGNIPSTSDEASLLRETGRESNRSVRLLFSASKEKILHSAGQASIIHFAGHSFYTNERESTGWKINGEEIVDLYDMENLGKGGSVPWFVFSNSCHAGNSGNSEDLSGIAGALMKAGVAQVAGPATSINDRDACKIATCFYKFLFKGMNPSQALLAMRKELGAGEISPLLYRLYGDPCYTTDKPESVKGEVTETRGKKSFFNKKYILIVSLLILILLILFFLPVSNNNIIYLPPR